jgi:hypothetical protein
VFLSEEQAVNKKLMGRSHTAVSLCLLGFFPAVLQAKMKVRIVSSA